MAATKSKNVKKSPKPAANGKPLAEPGDVLTLQEAAAYLRVPENDVVKAVSIHGMPGRQIGDSWRFLKSSLEDWLGTAPPKSGNEAILALAGAWKDDPFVEEELKEIYQRRGRPMVEEPE